MTSRDKDRAERDVERQGEEEEKKEEEETRQKEMRVASTRGRAGQYSLTSQ
jgi:hypothetical protein